MTLDTFFANFELLADAPGGVPKLRELILQLAVQGKLVPQDPADEPASVLLERIRAERNGQGKLWQTEPQSVEDTPYAVPDGWAWVKLREIAHDWGQKKPDIVFTYIDVSAIDKDQGVISDNVTVLQPDQAPSRARKIVREGTVIYSTIRPYLLNIAIVDRTFKPEPIVSTAFAVLHPFSGVDKQFLYYYLRSAPFVEYVASQIRAWRIRRSMMGSFTLA